MKGIQMVDLLGQYNKIQTEVDEAVLRVIKSSAYINGPDVVSFSENLAKYVGCKHVIPCANGTDALQIALMSLDLKQGDEIIVPSFTFIASAEVIGLLGFVPVMVDVEYDSFNTAAQLIEKAISPRTKAIIPVHLFGQSCDMEAILKLAKKYDLYIVEDNAQAIGATYTFSDGTKKRTGTIGNIGCTSFFPSKNLGAYGDGGAIFTNDDTLAEKMRFIVNHGQNKRYYHKVLGVNSRLDSIQAAILDIKLKHLDEYIGARYNAAQKYNEGLKDIKSLSIPEEMPYSTHVFHQYTLKVTNGKRDELKEHLEANGIPAMIYYPVPLHKQEAFLQIARRGTNLDSTEKLCSEVLSLPMHTELTPETQEFIIKKIQEFL